MIKRMSNIELLRIVAMLMIIGSHLAFHGVQHGLETDAYIIWNNGPIENQAFVSFLRPGGNIGVAIFFLIAGYFGVERKKICLNKIVLDSIFYGLIGACIGGGVLLQSKTVKIDMIRTIARMLFNPSSGGTWWFLTVYVLVVLLTPAIKEILLRNDKKAIKKILFLVWVIEYVMGYMSENPYWRIQQGAFYYFVGGYLKLFWDQKTHDNTKIKRRILVCTLWSINAILQFKTGKIIALGNKTLYQSLFTILAGTISETILTLGCAVELFLIFKEMKIQSSTINCVAKTTFGIYLLHEIPFMRSILWNSIFRVDGSVYLTRWFVPYAIFCVFMVFFFCMFIDLARIKFFEDRMIGLSKKLGV